MQRPPGAAITTPIGTLPPFEMLTFSGIFGTTAAPVEIWSWTLKAQPTEGLVGDRTTRAAEAARLWGVHLAPQQGANTRLQRVRLSNHVAGGDVAREGADGAYVQADWTVDTPGTMAGPQFPLQTAACVSLVTGRPGASGRGRFFLPAPPISLQADYRWSQAATDVFADSVRAFLEALAGNVCGPFVVASSKGFRSSVTAIRVGRVPDTMRSRRNAALEGYLTRTIVNS